LVWCQEEHPAHKNKTLVWLSVCIEVHMFAYDPADAIAIPKFHYYSFASLNLEWHLFFWYWLSQVVLKKRCHFTGF